MTKPRRALLVIADGGRKKGGACYGSFSIGGYPNEQPLLISRISLKDSTTSTQAEGEILCEAVATAVDGMQARSLKPAHWRIQIESDSLTLIHTLRTRTDQELDAHTAELEKVADDAFSQLLDKTGTDEAYQKARARLDTGRCMSGYVKKIRSLVEPFGEVAYQHVPRRKTMATFGH